MIPNFNWSSITLNGLSFNSPLSENENENKCREKLCNIIMYLDQEIDTGVEENCLEKKEETKKGLKNVLTKITHSFDEIIPSCCSTPWKCALDNSLNILDSVAEKIYNDYIGSLCYTLQNENYYC